MWIVRGASSSTPDPLALQMNAILVGTPNARSSRSARAMPGCFAGLPTSGSRASTGPRVVRSQVISSR
ncbi:MAG TPA: hypothetical protein VL463_18005 [Kofleriaceae bacterium]|nr:hypothetical protein [Kofleriaceae bacterium]